MKKMKNIFSVFLMVMFITGVGYAADSSCEDPENDYITAELALCSTHAYNIGLLENPTGAERELMHDVVAMKTTIITKQLYKQYEQMELMLRRLKTQLEKSLLMATLNVAAGGNGSGGDDGDSSSSSSSGRNGFSDAQNCNRVDGGMESAKTCLLTNISRIQNALDRDGDRSTARKQLITDLKAAEAWGFETPSEPCGGVKAGVKTKKADVQECLDKFRVKISNWRDTSKQQKWGLYVPMTDEDTGKPKK